MKISIITPTVRPLLLSINEKGLINQGFPLNEIEWLIVGPDIGYRGWKGKNPLNRYIDILVSLIEEPEKRKGDYYNLNKAWNAAFREAKGDLIVSLVDGVWIPPNALEKLWAHYKANPKACISCIGHQYSSAPEDYPDRICWSDPRVRTDQGSFYKVLNTEMELCLASFPKQAVLDVGGVDEEFDKYAALSEKEMMLRMEYAGYELYLCQDIEYRAFHHDRINEKWNEKYKAGQPYYGQCISKVLDGKRLKLKYVK